MYHVAMCAMPCTGCTDGDIRLTGGSTETEGTVEICHNQTWGMISGLGWGEEDARVTCRQLKLPVDGIIKEVYNTYKYSCLCCCLMQAPDIILIHPLANPILLSYSAV